jgi:putative FmdB family regulatory protein
MPIYEYQCQACGKEMEVSQRITEPALTECPECHEPRLQRLISATSFHLKGGGWYKDGYGSGSGTKRTENDRIDRVSKAIADDKAKTAASSSESSSASTSSGA